MTQRLAPAVLLAATLAAGTATAAPPARPAVVELFTSQGCSSCPPANDAVAELSERPDVIALSFGVTYWDYLGWKDTFARPDYTARQRAYAKALGHDGPFTPEVVVDGRADTVGNTPARILKLIAARRPADPTTVAVEDRVARIAAGAAPKGGAEVWLVRYDPRVVQVPVKRGENTGKTLPHKNVVRDLKRLGRWTGPAASFELPPAPAGLKTVVLVQSPDGGPILAAARAG
ncbi:DUF1223 domain-containing protein [Phenylobacterium sp.]|uniref:DUF1223 domain-containing protein n=1 Tax=Phenylobacterium sp. TaxID=1871053 RepID=UPI0035B462DA